MPLFSDEERVVVGTIYKQQSPQEALLKGLELVGPKMRPIIEQVKKDTQEMSIAVHCWRGGKRSGSTGWLLGMAGYQVHTLKGGYKAYRTAVLDQLATLPFQLVVLGGKTGCGKTKILHALADQGEQIIDLEGLANHMGSAFGFIGQPEQPTTEQFENNLYQYIQSLDLSKRIWIENESKGIGKIYLPTGFWKILKSAPLINIELPISERINNIIEDYTAENITALKSGFSKIQKRLGGQRYQSAMQLLDQQDIKGAAEIALAYYDKSYQYMLDNNPTTSIHHLQFERKDTVDIAKELISFIDRQLQYL